MLTVTVFLPCPQCAEFTGGIAFAIDGIRHTAPEIWFVGRRQALEAAGDNPTKATWQASKEWAQHCAELKARVS